MQKTRSGFTIVELLIVIVVIAILAAISIVAYNGIQSRARNNQQLTTARTYLNGLASYVAINNKYPNRSKARICLNLEQNECVTNTSWERDTVFETDLKTILTNLPQASTSIVLTGSPKMAYIPVTGNSDDLTLDGVATPFIMYSLEGSGICSVGSLVSGTWPNFSSTAPSYGFTGTSSGLRVCVVSLPRV